MSLRINLISCEVFYREAFHVAERSPNTIDIEFLPKGLHDQGGAAMRDEIQACLDRTDGQGYDAVALGYGLCNNGLAGIVARSIPFVLPRAHDCITLFLGSRQRYADYFQKNPGVYFQTTGWMERGGESGPMSQLALRRATGLDATYNELVEKYGEDNARYLWETLGDETRHYRQITFIEMGVEPDESCERQAMGHALKRGWCFKTEPGDISMLQRLVDGNWNEEEFLVVPPGRSVQATYDDGIISVRADPCSRATDGAGETRKSAGGHGEPPLPGDSDSGGKRVQR